MSAGVTWRGLHRVAGGWVPATVAGILFFCLIAQPCLAVPASPDLIELRQQDGSVYLGRQWGDEWRHGMETEEGFSVVFDQDLGSWTYAAPTTDGPLASSGIPIGSAPPPLGLPTSLRPSLAAGPERSAVPVGPERSTPASGTVNVPVILVNFSDKTTTNTAAQFQSLLFGTGVNSMRDYYLEVSYGDLTVTGGPAGVVGWYAAPGSWWYYGHNTDGSDSWPGTLVRRAVEAADTTVNFAPYDNDGDCYVDVVDIVHQGAGEEASGATGDIWSHSWDLNSAEYYGRSSGGEYTTNDPCAAGGFIRVNKYVIQPERYSTGMSTMGVFAHEFGHALGLPDLYDTNGGSQGAGDWSVMAGGSWCKVTTSGDRPSHPDPWSKWALGWLSPTWIRWNRTGEVITAASTAADVYQLLGGNETAGEYFLVENRQKTGFDAGLPGDGLLIWHVDAGWVAAYWDRNRVNASQCVPAAGDPTSCRSSHYGVSVEQADDGWDLERNYDRGDDADPFPGSGAKTSFSSATSPSNKTWAGTASPFSIASISASGATMTANFTISGPSSPDLYDDGREWSEFSPQAIRTGQTISISCDIRNGGKANAGAFKVKFYASADAVITSADHYIGQVSMAGVAAEDYESCDFSGIFPAGLYEGWYYVGWIIDADSEVAEFNEDNNAAVRPGDYLFFDGDPDLTDCGEQYRSFSPTTIRPGEAFDIDGLACSVGTAATDVATTTRFYASTNTVITSSDYLLGSFELPFPIKPTECNGVGIVVPFPSGIPAGNYYVGWILDAGNMLAESNETNNTAYKTGYKLTVRSGVDLSDGGEGTSYFSPRTVYPGAYFAIHHNVRNTGELTASNVVVRYYVSTDTTITSSDRLIGESTIPTILPGNSASGDWAALFPSGIPVGTYWVGWIIDPDNAFAEIYENNNTIRKTSYQLSVVNAPDLVDAGAAYQSFSPTTVYYGRPFSISCDIRNAGLAAAPGYAVSFYASTDTTITAGDTYLGYRAMGGLAAGATADCDHSLTFPPLADGLYYVGWIIDSLNAVSETDETNNVAYNVNGRLRVLNPTVDLSEADPGMRSFSPEAVKGGDPFSVSIAVGNGGTVGSGPFVVRFYASPDKGITGADWLIGESAVADLPSKGEAKVSWSGTFPVLIPAGSYYVGWIIDAAGAVGETDETNNTGFVNDPQLAVETEPLPDLTDGGEAQRSFSPRKMRTGETISISFLLVNQGYEAAKGFVVRFYASEDREITPGDRLIGETPVAELAPRDNVTCSFSGPLPGTIPPGEYGVGWIIDAGGSVEELNEGNNTAICQESSLIVTETENQAPTDLALSPSSVMENQAAGTVVGALSTTDPDAGDIHAYSLVAGTGSADNGLFTIVGSQLRSAVILDYETKPGCAVRVRTTDQGGLWYEEALTVAVVNDPSDDPAGSSFANIATRGKVLTGANILIGGITVAGTSQKTFVFRGLGPSLTAYGVPGALANPVIRVYSGATVVATNDDWGSLSPADRTVLSAEGLTPTHPRDSALVLTLNPGPYTLHLSGLNNGTGVGLVEVYETSLWGAGSPPDEGGVIEEDERLLELQGYRRGSGVVPVTLWEPAAKVAAQEEEPSLATSATDGLSNIATRGKVLTGADVMIAGFTIVGGDPMTVVIRGIGPSLAAYGVPGALANPMLQVYSGSTVIATNDNWGTLGSSDKAVLTMEGLTPTHSLEAAVVLTLAPGPYTAVLSGVNKGTGVGLVEVYDAAKW